MSVNTFDDKQYVIFELGVEAFGMDINTVKEIINYQETTQLPGAGYLIEGIINLRGHVIPVFSLRKKFGFPEKETTKRTRIVVVETDENTVGIVVDAVAEVLRIPGELIEKPSSLVSSGVDNEYISGIAKMEDSLIIILNLESVINSGIANAV